ncbi:MFS transporter [Novosphingobium resinovorum]|uniref:MFS transporter n=1 Tax=Novosphingobium resinovorum TaxID=158500 RepID=A0A031JYA5_9SPHN|nr:MULTISPECIES: MFS transporter [Sphingomonadaceae]AOR79066.1 MFS transporter [Novosphingobium resinovorum]EJU10208.1 major facilitator superfamily protein [Sphingomonas sp. LH128]EZP82736.1 Major facilitator superfamily protein [Novosphingobium resinovorum]MBF7014619.1 MFS transporter [Novosphingobium sp. HR1a]WJM24900.1 MFS transporter [Novosphingobium resinovorum]
MPSASTRLAIAATTGNLVCLTAAISATFGTFLVPISQDLGWSRAAVSGVLGLIAIIAAASYPLIGRTMDRVGARPMIMGGNVALALLVASLSQTSGSLWLFYLQYGLIGLAGATCASPMIAKIVSNWFDARRGLMLGVTAGIGNGVGATLMPVVAGILLPLIGWRATYGAIGAIVLLLGFPIMWFWLHDTPGHVSRKDDEPERVFEGMTLREAASTRRFWLLLLAVASGAGGMTAVFTHVVPMMTDRGFGLGQATGVVATFALVTAAWQVVTGGMLDKLRTPLLIVPMYAAAMAGLGLLQFGQGGLAATAAGVLLGIGMGAEYAALPYFCSRYFGLRHFGSINAVLYAAVILAQGLTPAAMDLSYGATGSYNEAALAIIVVLGAGMALLFFLPGIGADGRTRVRPVKPVASGDLAMAAG